MEIERKYLIEQLPDLSKAQEVKEMEQGYISTDPVIRVRKSNNSFILTCKGRGLLAREEFELFIEEASYEHLKQKIDHNLIVKTRYLFPYQNHTIELDIFHDHLEGLFLAEVEFNTMEEANSFVAPSWFGKDVTMDSDYHNSQLASKTDLGHLTDLYE